VVGYYRRFIHMFVAKHTYFNMIPAWRCTSTNGGWGVKTCIRTTQINSSNYINPSNSKVKQTIFSILWYIWKNNGEHTIPIRRKWAWPSHSFG
jgi:hypothetical protein